MSGPVVGAIILAMIAACGLVCFAGWFFTRKHRWDPLNAPVQAIGNVFEALDEADKGYNQSQAEMLATIEGLRAELREVYEDANGELQRMKAMASDRPAILTEIKALEARIKGLRERLGD